MKHHIISKNYWIDVIEDIPHGGMTDVPSFNQLQQESDCLGYSLK
jgi:hypothetical protein